MSSLVDNFAENLARFEKALANGQHAMRLRRSFRDKAIQAVRSGHHDASSHYFAHAKRALTLTRSISVRTRGEIAQIMKSLMHEEAKMIAILEAIKSKPGSKPDLRLV